ncbi:hypothetical protein AVEN_87248-1, partial [Araneus ventricosus]
NANHPPASVARKFGEKDARAQSLSLPSDRGSKLRGGMGTPRAVKPLDRKTDSVFFSAYSNEVGLSYSTPMSGRTTCRRGWVVAGDSH